MTYVQSAVYVMRLNSYLYHPKIYYAQTDLGAEIIIGSALREIFHLWIALFSD